MRIEVASALARGVLVVPVLLDGAGVPSAEQLPDDLKPLAWRNGVEVRRLTFEADAMRLIKGLGLGRSRAVVRDTARAPHAPPQPILVPPPAVTHYGEGRTAILRIKRDFVLMGLHRKFELLIDGALVGVLGHGRALAIEVESPRTLQFASTRLWFWRRASETLVLPPAPGAVLEVRVRSTMWGQWPAQKVWLGGQKRPVRIMWIKRASTAPAPATPAPRQMARSPLPPPAAPRWRCGQCRSPVERGARVCPSCSAVRGVWLDAQTNKPVTRGLLFGQLFACFVWFGVGLAILAYFESRGSPLMYVGTFLSLVAALGAVVSFLNLLRPERWLARQ